MSRTQLGGIAVHISKLVTSASVRELSDAQPLQLFATGRTEAAFAALGTAPPLLLRVLLPVPDYLTILGTAGMRSVTTE